MTYEQFKTDFFDAMVYFGRNTKRKINNSIKADMQEVIYRIEAIEPQIQNKGFARLYGEVLYKRDLKNLKNELTFLKQIQNEKI